MLKITLLQKFYKVGIFFLVSLGISGNATAQDADGAARLADPEEKLGIAMARVPWLRVLVDGNRNAAEALNAMEMVLFFQGTGAESAIVLSGNIVLPEALFEVDDHSTVLIDRYPLDFLATGNSEPVSLFHQEILHVQLTKANSDGTPEARLENEPRVWRTLDVLNETGTTPTYVVLLERSLYCPLVDIAAVPECEGVADDETGATTTQHAESVEDTVVSDDVRPVARGEAETALLSTVDSTGSEPPPPEPVNYDVSVSLRFLDVSESAFGRTARSFSEYCAIQFVRSGHSDVAAANVNFRAEPPVITTTISDLPNVSLDLEQASLRFSKAEDSFLECAYDGTEFAIDDMAQADTIIVGRVTLPATKPRFQLIYDLSGQLIVEDEQQSNAAIMGFAARVKDVLNSRLIYASSKYVSLDEYFAWVPSTSPDPYIEPMSELDLDGSAEPSLTQYLHELNEGVRMQMLDRISESIAGVRPAQISGNIDQVGEKTSVLLEAGDLVSREPNLRVLVQVANTARAACLDASLLESGRNSEIRRTEIRRIVAVAETQLSFDTDLTEETRDSLIWRCRSETDHSVETWLVSLSDVARNNDWQALENQLSNIDRRLIQ